MNRAHPRFIYWHYIMSAETITDNHICGFYRKSFTYTDSNLMCGPKKVRMAEKMCEGQERSEAKISEACLVLYKDPTSEGSVKHFYGHSHQWPAVQADISSRTAKSNVIIICYILLAEDQSKQFDYQVKSKSRGEQV